MNKPKVSVIITTKNEEVVIERLLKSIISQTYENLEIIVVDNNSSDKTLTIVNRYKSKIFNLGPERSAQRNYGVNKASGKYVLILDADMELSPSVVEECVKELEKSSQIGGVIIPEESIASNFWERVKAFERSFYNQSGDTIAEGARFFPRQLFLNIGGYDEGITGPEDWDLPETIRKKGYAIRRIRSKIYHHERIKSLLSLAKKKYYYALKSHRYLSKQNIPIISPKTIYFLRPVFYKNWRRLISEPTLAIGMLIMFIFELAGGGIGYFIGRYKKI